MPTDDPSDTDRYRAPALDKGLDILELLADQKEGLTRAEITKSLGRNASEMYRMLERLVARQYVVRSAGGDRYSLSLKLYALAPPAPADEPPDRAGTAGDAAFRRALRAIMSSRRLRSRQPAGDRAGDGPGTWGISVRLGARVGLIDTGSGRVLLAFQTAEQRAHMLAEHTRVKGEINRDPAALESEYPGHPAAWLPCARKASRRSA